jgi:hypothetical protein
MLHATYEVCLRVLGGAHPDTVGTAQTLEKVRSRMRAVQPTKKGGQVAARRNERAAVPVLSATAQAEAEVRARAAEVELLAMLDLDEPEVGARSGSGSARGSAKSKANDRRGKRRG